MSSFSARAALLLSMGAIGGMANAQSQLALKAAFKDDFRIGAALSPAQFCESNLVEAALVKAQFNSLTPENVMKWEQIHPLPGQYDFALADRYVAFGEAHRMFVIGHTLVWHRQTPAWVFELDGKPASREVLLQRMREHIGSVVGRYKGRVHGWDVVNEALNEDGTLRQSPWLQIIGEDYLVKAFQFAHEADPGAELYYNDYALENTPKRLGAVALVTRLQAAGVKLHGIGTQQHINLLEPTAAQVDEALTAFGALGIKVMVTELDVDVLPSVSSSEGADVSSRVAADPALNPYTNALPAAVELALADRYAAMFAVYCKHRGTLDRVTFWGVTDAQSWLNNWPVPGRTAYPLAFDREGKPKAALKAIIDAQKPNLTSGKIDGPSL